MARDTEVLGAAGDGAGTKADEVALLIEEAIVSGELAPDTVLRQEQLAERFDVSRTPVREALRRLAAVGLLSFAPNRGFRVRSVSRDELREAFLVRAELEGLAAELATPRMTADDLEGLDRAGRDFADLTRALRDEGLGEDERHALEQDWIHANERFHDVLLEAAGSPLLEQMARSVRRTFFGQAVWVHSPEIDELYNENLLQHRAICEVIAAGSPAAARQLAREHVLASGRLLEAVLDELERARAAR